MAEPVTIARPYAEAAFKLARERADLPRWSDMLSLLSAVTADPQVQACINDPKLSAQQLEGLILGIVGDRVDGLGRNLVQVLIRNGRLNLLPEVRELYENLKREHEGILEAKITFALPVDGEQLDQLVVRLEERYKRKVKARVEIDPKLIGGAKIEVGDKVIDATVRGKLEAMAAALTR